MLIADTSGLLSFFDTSEPDLAAVEALLADDRGPIVVSPYVVAELDYLVAKRWGTQRELAILDELGSGDWTLACLDAQELQLATRVVQQYADQSIGVTDASIVVLAERYKTDRILTLDRRNFSVLRQRNGKPFTILPG